MTFIQRLEELADLVGVWRSAAYDVIAAHDALGAPGMEKR